MRSVQKRIPIERLVLGVIVVAGVLPLLAITPGLALVLKRLGFEKRLKNKQYVPDVLNRLEKKGLIRFEGVGDQRRVRTTKQGKDYFLSKRDTLLYRPKRRPWDGNWRIVMFDIPQAQRRRRDLLRRELKEVGFKKLQGSVWVSPDECEEYIKLLKADRHIGKSLIYLKTKDIEYHNTLKHLFKIS